MEKTTESRSFLMRHVFPAFLIFVIPLFSLWFFAYAVEQTDLEIATGLKNSIRSDPGYTHQQRQSLTDYIDANPISKLLASSSPAALAMRNDFAAALPRYRVFAWMQSIAIFCLEATVATVALAGLTVAGAFGGPVLQYRSLLAGSWILRASATLQVLGQAILTGFLSFWVTAIFWHEYSIKVIVVIAVLASVAVLAVIGAIFSKVDEALPVEGRLLREDEAPPLWQRLREFAALLSTAPPDQVVVGIEPSFFVTESPVRLQEQVYNGRTLYLSLPMLKVLSPEEADAVLGHELAHFSGKDTF